MKNMFEDDRTPLEQARDLAEQNLNPEAGRRRRELIARIEKAVAIAIRDGDVPPEAAEPLIRGENVPIDQRKEFRIDVRPKGFVVLGEPSLEAYVSDRLVGSRWHTRVSFRVIGTVRRVSRWMITDYPAGDYAEFHGIARSEFNQGDCVRILKPEAV